MFEAKWVTVCYNKAEKTEKYLPVLIRNITEDTQTDCSYLHLQLFSSKL